MSLFGRKRAISDVTERRLRFEAKTLGELREIIQELDRIQAPDTAKVREPFIETLTLYVTWEPGS